MQLGSTNGSFGRRGPHWRSLQGTCLMVPLNSSGMVPVHSSGMEGPPAPFLLGSQPLDRSWESPPGSASRGLGLEAGRTFLQGCKAVEDSFPLRVVFALDIFIDFFIKTTAGTPHRPKASPPLPTHRETPATSVPGNLEKGRWISSGGPFIHNLSALENDRRHSGRDFFFF